MMMMMMMIFAIFALCGAAAAIDAFVCFLTCSNIFVKNISPSQQWNQDIPLRLLHDGMNWLKEHLQIPGERQYNNVLIGGILGSLFSSLQFLANPVFGLLSDINGRKTILLISMAGTALSYVLWMQANTFTVFLASRVVGGLSKGSVTICTAIMADLTSKETRGKAMALVGVAFSIGFSIGPLVGAYFAAKTPLSTGSQLHSAVPLICIGLQVLTMLVVVVFLEESQKNKRKLPRQEVVKFCLHHLNPFGMLSRISSTKSARDVKMSVVWSLGVTQFFYLVLFSGLEFTLTFLTHERFLFSRRQQGMLFLFIGIFMSLTQGGYVRRVKHGSEKRVALQGIGVLIPAMIIVALATTVSMVYVGVFLYCFGAATVIPCLTTLVSKQAGDDDNGEILGIFRSLGALARAFGPFLTCSLYWSVGSTVCYFVGGVLFLAPLLHLSRIQVDTKAA